MAEDNESKRLTEGYNTLDFMIENRGDQFPTAALQKLNFARAYLKKPKILLLERSISKISTTKS